MDFIPLKGYNDDFSQRNFVHSSQNKTSTVFLFLSSAPAGF